MLKGLLNSLIKGMILLLFVSSSSLAYTQEKKDAEDLVDRVNDELKKAGVRGGYVQIDERNRLRLSGTYKNYDEFIYALMMLYLVAGNDKVNPTYDTRVAIIKATTPELCFPYAIKGQECPYGRMNIKKVYAPAHKKPQSEKFALVIGISEFYKNQLSPVYGADTDARSFARYLQDKGYKVTLLLNDNATLDKVKEEIQKLLSQVSDGDELIVYAASHGAPVDGKGEVGVVLYDSIEKGPENNMSALRECRVEAPSSLHAQAAKKMCTIVKNSLSIKNNIVDAFADKKVNLVVILDACYSGDALRSYLKVDNPYTVATTEEYENVLRSAPNLGMVLTASSGDRLSWGAPLKGDFLNSLTSFTRGKPRYVFSDGGGKERNVYHGIFTAFFLEALEQKNGSVVEAYKSSREEINRVSHTVCNQNKVGGRDIRIEPVRITRVECPPGGQNPQLFRVRLEDYNFESRKTLTR